jgi:hypothetical protein
MRIMQAAGQEKVICMKNGSGTWLLSNSVAVWMPTDGTSAEVKE